MGFDVCAVDHSQTVDRALPRQSLEDLQLQALAAPAIEAIVDRRVRAIDRWAVSPASARAQHMHDAADDPPIVDTAHPAPSSRHQPLNARPFRIAHLTRWVEGEGVCSREEQNQKVDRAEKDSVVVLIVIPYNGDITICG